MGFGQAVQDVAQLEVVRESLVQEDVTPGDRGAVHDASPRDVAFIQYSSGSTSDPKGVCLTHENLCVNIRAIVEGFGWQDDDQSLSWMPLTHDMGLIGFHLSTLAAGMNHAVYGGRAGALEIAGDTVLVEYPGEAARTVDAEPVRLWDRPYGMSDAEIEDFLRTAEITQVEDLGEGVTRPRRLTLKEDGKVATSDKWMWLVRGGPPDRPVVLFHYDASRSEDVPSRLLDGFTGVLQTDGYAGYNQVCRDNPITRIGCWDHARRKFVEASKAAPSKRKGEKVSKADVVNLGVWKVFSRSQPALDRQGVVADTQVRGEQAAVDDAHQQPVEQVELPGRIDPRHQQVADPQRDQHPGQRVGHLGADVVDVVGGRCHRRCVARPGRLRRAGDARDICVALLVVRDDTRGRHRGRGRGSGQGRPRGAAEALSGRPSGAGAGLRGGRCKRRHRQVAPQSRRPALRQLRNRQQHPGLVVGEHHGHHGDVVEASQQRVELVEPARDDSPISDPVG